MAIHLYLSLLPEALIASMLSPEDFGTYYAVGSAKKSRGQAMFFEVDPNFRHPYFRMEEAIQRCVPHEDGSLKASVYVSVYRVLEHMDLDALMHLYLTTMDGRTLELSPSNQIPNGTGNLHLYQEIVPVSPLVVSRLGPMEFIDQIVRNPVSLVKLPAIVFTELLLGELAEDPEMGLMENLPYSNRDHLRQCLTDVKTKYASTKMVDRTHSPDVHYRTIKNGFYVGNQEQLRYFPMPSPEEIRTNNYRWFRSANM
ncbi:MAG TPA: hypothetical protein GX730_01590 [Chloroflexi bacterium]|jgi:hypothetical protein|nr:hypothetical protein [Anaerolineaceae bacterium]HHX08115.1 hypothetical protein [Chloroflexota bacterium]